MTTIRETIKTTPDATLETLQIVTGLSRSGVRKIIDKLRTQGKIRRVGPPNGGHWEVVE